MHPVMAGKHRNNRKVHLISLGCARNRVDSEVMLGVLLNDGWTAVTRDRSYSAQFEHSIGITENGFEIFTLSPKGWHAPPYG